MIDINLSPSPTHNHILIPHSSIPHPLLLPHKCSHLWVAHKAFVNVPHVFLPSIRPNLFTKSEINCSQRLLTNAFNYAQHATQYHVHNVVYHNPSWSSHPRKWPLKSEYWGPRHFEQWDKFIHLNLIGRRCMVPGSCMHYQSHKLLK